MFTALYIVRMAVSLNTELLSSGHVFYDECHVTFSTFQMMVRRGPGVRVVSHLSEVRGLDS